MKRQIDDLTFSVVRSRRRTADIVVERDVRVVVRAPESVSAEAIDDAVRGNAAWVHRTIAEWKELNAARRRRAFVQGSSFLYLGRNYRLRFVTAPSRPLMLKNGWFDLDERVAAKVEHPLRARLSETSTHRGPCLCWRRGWRFSRPGSTFVRARWRCASSATTGRPVGRAGTSTSIGRS